ncbi:putative uncharacterized protein FLJ37770 [Centruroides sculpturatus]|uniref:putative uncharacterized protein FLJ37770 n=1 Tax=Centruroides sculpturatus TaxID=218467 RepID=UPI000C6E277D|nr:putative uncharacterized protein FLJ37770 [Centruroides sculpturatus]
MEFQEQHCNIKFCQHLGKTATETLKLLRKVYGDSTMAKSKVYEWHQHFRESRESIADDEHSGRPLTSQNEENVELVTQCVHKDRCQTLEKITVATHLSKTSCQRILTKDFNMHRVSQHIVPQLLTSEQKEKQMRILGDLIDKANKEPAFLNHITGDEM